MFNFLWRQWLRQRSPAFKASGRGKAIRRERGLRVRLEELESRLAPASFAVNAQLQISRLDSSGDTTGGTHAVVFFESAVADYQVLRQGLSAGTDAVVLDSGGDRTSTGDDGGSTSAGDGGSTSAGDDGSTSG